MIEFGCFCVGIALGLLIGYVHGVDRDTRRLP